MSNESNYQKPSKFMKKVTPIGEGWILCKSKSHREHNYYFNTLTGETTWNLSDAEVEKARKYTKSLTGQPGAKPILCPEPKGKPPTKPTTSPARMNKLMPRKHLINPFIEDNHSTSFSNVLQNGQFCNIMNQMNNFTELNMESINNLNALNLNPSIANTSVLSIYNPNVWAVPNTQPILINPSMAPSLVNQAQPTINVAYNLPMSMQQGGIFATDCVEDSNNSRSGSHLSEQGNARKTLRFNSSFISNNKYKKGLKHASNRFYIKNDLRQRIGRKRSKSVSTTKPPITWELNKNAKTTEVDSDGHNEDPIMNHRYAQTHEESSKLDLGPLTSLAPPGVNPDWFVVVDLNVLLTEFKFLNNLTDSDDKCHLLVPVMVMVQLQKYVSSSNDVPARRILRFLSQQIEIGFAFMAEDPSNLKENSNAEVMFKSCMEQANRNYFVVLISNDEEILSFKDSSNVTIYSATEIKRLLNFPFITQTSSITKQNPISLEKIKIVVQNNNNTEIDLDYNNKQRNDDVSACGTELCNNQDLNNQNEVLLQEKEKLMSKSTADAGIQTDFEYIDRSTNDKESTNENFKDISSCSVDKESSVNVSMPTKVNTFGKKREIKLIRSVSNKQQVVDSGEKKHLTWRRRRNTNPVSNNSTNNCAGKMDQYTKLISPVKFPITKLSGDHKNNCKIIEEREICDKNLGVKKNMENPDPNTVTNNYDMGAKKVGNDNNCMESTSRLLRSQNFTQASENSLCNLSGPAVNSIETKKLKSPLNNIKTVSPTRKICITNSKDLDKELENNISQLKIKPCCNETTDAEKMPSYQIRMKQPSSTNNILFDQLKATITVNVCTTENDNTKRVRHQTLDSVDKPNRNLNESVSSSLSSVDILVRSTPGDNITVEETSTSGIISNSESNVDECDYTFSNQHESGTDSDYEQNMYHIDNDKMGEYLAVKCDEWVSRYIQIMEEVLTLVLHSDPPFSHKTFPPPWTLHEATQCIKIKFIDHPIVRHGADTLSSILFNLSDAKGKISMDMSPYQYMKMYSAGVYLLACLKAVINNSDDIQIAVESLKLLLNDIKSPAQDNNKSDELNETPQKVFVENETEIKENDQNSEEQLIAENCVHNLRSDKSEHTREEVEEPLTVKFVRKIDIKSSFFENLSQNDTDVDKNTYTQTKQCNEKDSNYDERETEPPLQQPKIVRNFTLCPDIEKKLQSKFKEKPYDYQDNDLDYEEDFGEYLTEEYGEDEHHDNIIPNQDLLEEYEDTEEDNCEDETTNEVKPDCSGEANVKFRYMMHVFLKEVSEALSEVKSICDRCYAELRRPHQSESYKYELKQKAEKAQLHLTNLCGSLDNMLEHGTRSADNTFREWLKKVDVDMGHVTNDLLSEYRTTVAECKEHAAIFLDAIQDVIAALKSTHCK